MDPFNSALIHNFTRNIKILETEVGSNLVIKKLCSHIFLWFFFLDWIKNFLMSLTSSTSLMIPELHGIYNKWHINLVLNSFFMLTFQFFLIFFIKWILLFGFRLTLSRLVQIKCPFSLIFSSVKSEILPNILWKFFWMNFFKVKGKIPLVVHCSVYLSITKRKRKISAHGLKETSNMA